MKIFQLEPTHQGGEQIINTGVAPFCHSQHHVGEVSIPVCFAPTVMADATVAPTGIQQDGRAGVAMLGHGRYRKRKKKTKTQLRV
ncbi:MULTISPECIES: hypothetical protein [Mycobacterium]|nr:MULTISPECIES: hypothetical protein [Mycobacterium]MDA3642006.1 hypothetical protein [Mycobacterium xenopi]MDA3660229.1 hypothetical protein [Mycobacterium xenopi]MDA3664362.1 hypothetical protein [Mycobacterium xenopi]